MRRRRFNRQPLVAACAFAFTSGAACAAPGEPIGPEFLVNTSTAGEQRSPAVGMRADGQFGVAWIAETSDGASVAYKRYDADRTYVDETPVGAGSGIANVAIAMSDYGDANIVWQSNDDGDGSGIFASTVHHYSGVEARNVNQQTAGEQTNPAVATDRDGRSTFYTWSTTQPTGGHGVRGRRFDFTSQSSDEFVVDADDAAAPRESAVAVAESNAVVAWTAPLVPGAPAVAIVLQRFDAEGNALGSRVTVTEQGEHPALALNAAGGVVVVWQRVDEVFGRRFDAAGNPLGAEFLINGSAAAGARLRLASDGNGGFIVAYATSGGSVAAYRVDAGDTTSGPFALGATDGSVGMDVDGDFVAVWTGADADGAGIVGRRYRGASIDLALTVSAPISAHYGSAYRTYFGVENPNPYPFPSAVTVHLEKGLGADQYGPFPVEDWEWDCTEGPTEWTCRLLGDQYGAGWSAKGLAVDYVAPNAAELRVSRASLSFDQDDPDPADNTAAASTRIGDADPDPIVFAAQTDVARNVAVDSEARVVTGIDVPAEATVDNGLLSVNGGPFGNSNIVSAGDAVQLRQWSSSAYATTTTTRLYVGAGVAQFSTTTAAADATPDAFAFTDVSGVARSSLQTSNAVTVSGIETAAPIGVAGGEFSINGGAWRTSATTVANGAGVRVRHTSSAAFSTATNTVLTIGGVSDTFTSTTLARDTVPDAFAFADQPGVARNAEITSSEIVVSGVNDATPIAVTGGSYSVDGGAFTTTAGTVQDGQRVRVRHTSASAFAASVATTLDVGGVVDTFTSTTETLDTTPDAFAFADQGGVATGTTVTSAPVTVGGINAPAPIGVSGGLYSVNGGAFTAASGAVGPGDQVRVQHTSASSATTAVDTTVTIGGVADTFTSTTGATDTTPNAFAFVDQAGVKRSRVTESNTITVSGINAPVAVSVAGGGAQYSKNGGAWTSTPGTIANGNTLKVRLTSSSAAYTTVATTVTIGGVSDVWSVTTGR